MPNMVFETIIEPRLNREVLFTLHKSIDPTVEEWDAYVANFKRSDPEKLLQLVITLGGGPSSKQRKDFNEMLHGRTTQCSVVTPSTVVRGMVTALGWFNPKIKSFPPNEMPLALRHIKLETPEQADWAINIVRRLLDKLDPNLKSVILTAA